MAPQDKSANSPPYKQEFLDFPLVVLRASDGKYVECRCFFCDGNLRTDSPHYFYRSVRYLTEHMKRAHSEAEDKDHLSVVHDPRTRVLTDEEVEEFRQGRGHGLIKMKVVAGPTDDYEATSEVRTITVGDSRMPFGRYPTIFKYESRYYHLFCRFCKHNARLNRGALAQKNPRRIWFRGMKGLISHVDKCPQKTAGSMKGKSMAWWLKNCAKLLSPEYVDLIKKHPGIGDFIPKFALPRDLEEWSTPSKRPGYKGLTEAGKQTGGEMREIGAAPEGSQKGGTPSNGVAHKDPAGTEKGI